MVSKAEQERRPRKGPRSPVGDRLDREKLMAAKAGCAARTHCGVPRKPGRVTSGFSAKIFGTADAVVNVETDHHRHGKTSNPAAWRIRASVLRSYFCMTGGKRNVVSRK